MPASTDLVSIDHAKDWARRLQKSVPALAKLSEAQSAVASMLGHASWHALTAFYQNQASPVSAPPSTDLVVASAPRAPAAPGHEFDDVMNSCLVAINAQYPGLDAVQVEVLANETDEIEMGADEIINAARDIENEEGCFFSDALEMAMERNQVTVHAPPKHLMVRVMCANGQRSLVVISSEAYLASSR